MLVVELPDGSKKEYSNPVTVGQVAESIGSGLAKASIAGCVDGTLVDTSFLIETDTSLRIITNKDTEALEVLRHSCAHLLAQAVKQLFPEAEVTIGPVIQDGFYYDFAFSRPFTLDDLAVIEKRMYELAAEAIPVEREEISREEAIKLFTSMQEKYKVEIIKDVDENQVLTFYKQGDFVDLCRGPHVPNTKHLKAFKLTKVAGAYWRGDSNNPMLYRIYGTAWANKNDLESYLHRIEEAEKRDHRKIAKKLNLFHFQEEAPGMVFWHPKGLTVYNIMQDYIRDILAKYDYHEIRTPQLVDRSLWERSGHWEVFRQNMFTLTSDDYHHAIKPMSCPCHVQVFNQGIKSYRDLPLRYSEFGCCHRYEPSGALHGLLRVRSFVQDDGHIFCTEDQIQSEVSKFIDLLFEVYKDFGFETILVRLSTRPDHRVGSDEIWDKAENSLSVALKEASLEYEILPGEGAFYGPKIEFSLEDCLGRIWQCGTIQVDFSMPERLGAQYVALDGSRQVPVMLHRAILGTFERFMGILLEQTAGDLSAWLAPVQIAVMTITDKQNDYCKQTVKILRENGLRVLEDLRNEKIGFKIREHTIQKVLYLVVVGKREEETETLSVRTLSGEDLGVMGVGTLIDRLKLEVKNKRRKT